MSESTVSKTKYPFKADTVGSLLRPDKLKKAYFDFDKGNISLRDLEKIENVEINRIVKKQVDLGLKTITDGEFSRRHFLLDFLAGLNGVKKIPKADKVQFKNKTITNDRLELEDRISYNPNHSFFKSFKYLKSIVPKETTPKLTIPSPTPALIQHRNFALIRNWADFYKKRSQYLDDLVQAYRKSILHFYKLGARYIQLDDPFWPYLIQGFNQTKNNQNEYSKFTKLADEFTSVTKRIISNLPSDLVLTTHICRGNFKSTYLFSGGYKPVIKYLKQLPFDAFFLEYDNFSQDGDFSPLTEFYQTQPKAVFVLGIVTSKFPNLESKGYLKQEIKKASQYVPLDHLALSTQCGFASTQEGNDLTEDQQWKKLKLVVDTAKEIWKN